MVPLRFPWLWALLGWALLIGVCVASLVPAYDLPKVGVSDKLEHAGSYFLLMLWFAGLYPPSRHLRIALGLFALSAVLDVLQLGTATRQFDLHDIAANGAGIAAALALSYFVLGGWCQRVERWLVPSNP
jgi:VanZ family protein